VTIEIIDWPSILQPIDATIPYLGDSVASSGPTITGYEGVVEGLAARWIYGFKFKIWTKPEHMSWRALMSRARGRAGYFRVPICDCRFAPGLSGANSGLPITSTVPHSDDAPHGDDDTPYEQDNTAAILASTALGGAITMDVTTGVPVDVQPGNYISDGTRFYAINRADIVSGNTWRISFSPRLRKTLIAGSYLSFSQIRCVMRMTEDSSLSVEAVLGKFAMHQVSFIEAKT
jgi:hypothetical protein